MSSTSTSIYKFGLSVCLFVCLSVCLFVSNKRQNGWTDQAQIFCRTSRDPREGLWKIKISNICLASKFDRHKIFINFENPRIIFVLFYDLHKENMFTTNLEDGREAPSKARKKDAKRLEFLVSIKSLNTNIFMTFWIQPNNTIEH